MEKMSLAEIIQAVDGSFGFPVDTMVSAISTDTRKITKDSVFVALKGERFDGHDFAAEAMKLGAAAVIAERPVEGAKCIIVDSSAKALLDLANFYRRKFDIPLIGITGSVGKTTTKDMIAYVVSRKYKTLKTQGNFNNEIGLPQTLFGLDRSYEAAVIEMGMSHFGEISRLSMCACPTCAVITNIGVSHIENLGTQENILKAKLEILDGAEYGAPLILSRDDKFLAGAEIHGGRKTVYYSVKKKDCQVFAAEIENGENSVSFTVNYPGGRISAVVNCPGEHNVKNALAAFCVGLELGIEPEEIVRGIAEYRPEGMRQNITEKNGIKFILDCYNAAPDSMKASLAVLAQTHTDGRKYAVLGDMLELGKNSRQYHRTVGKYAAASDADMLLCYGENSAYYIEGAVQSGFSEDSCRLFSDRKELTVYLKKILEKGDTVLVKGSRGMRLEEVVNGLE